MALSSVVVDFVANVSKYLEGLDKMDKSTKKWSGGVNKDVKELGNVFKAFASGGVEEGAKSLLNFGLKLSGATVVLGTFAAAGVAALKFSAEFANRLKDLSDRSDISTQGLQGLEDAFKSSGVQLEEVVAANEKLSRAALDAADGNEALQKSFAKLGINVDNFNKLSAEKKLLEIAKSLEAVTDPAERAKLSFEILGKTSGNLKVGLSELAKGNDEFNNSFKNSDTALNALDALSKGYESFGSTAKRMLVEVTGQTVAFVASLGNLPKQTPNLYNIGMAGGQAANAPAKTAEQLAAEAAQVADAEKRRAEALRLSNELFAKSITAFAGSSTPLAAYREEIDKITKTYDNLIKGQTDAGLLQQAEAARLDKTTAAYKKFNDALGDRNTFLAAIDNGAALSAQLKKLAEDIFLFNRNQEIAGRAKNKIGDEEENKLIADLAYKIGAAARAFTEIDDPVSKYRRLIEEAKKVTNEFGETLNEIDPYIIEKYKKSLGQSYTEAANPAEKYKRIVADIGAQQAAGIITDIVAEKSIRALADSYIEIIKPIEKYNKIKMDVLANPALSTQEQTKYLESLGDGYRSLIDSSISTKKALQDFDAQVATGIIAKGKQADSIREQIQLQYDLSEASKEATLINSDRAKADVEYLKTLNDINLAFGKEGENLSKVNERTMAVREAQAKWMSETLPYFKDAVNITQNFADGLANAIASGQNFGDALKNVFQDVLKQITVLILRTTILQAIMASIGLASPVAATAFGNLTGIAQTGKAAGGPVTAGMPYRVGEAGPEMFVPTTNGVILPNNMSGGNQTQVVQNIYVQTGVAQTVRAEMAALLPSFKQQAIAGVVEAKQRGGSYGRALAAA